MPLGAFGNKRGATLGERGRIAANDLLSLAAPYRMLREINSEGAPVGDDSMAWNPTSTEYSNPEMAADIAVRRKQFRRRGEQSAILDQVLRFRPRSSTLRDRLDGFLEGQGIEDDELENMREFAAKFRDPEWRAQYLKAYRRKQHRDLARQLDELRADR